MATAVRENDIDSLTNLEERISKAVEVVARLRSEKEALQSQLEAVTGERDAANVQAQKIAQELEELRSERKQVRTRIEKLLGQMDLLSAG
jgi:FtsZ-binding cell division protein ZapB